MANANTVGTVRCSLEAVGLREEYYHLLDLLVQRVNYVVAHAFQFARFIFVAEMSRRRTSFNPVLLITENFFREVFCWLTNRAEHQTMPRTAQWRSLLRKHWCSYRRWTGVVVQIFNALSHIAKYAAVQMATAYLNNVSLHFGEKLRSAVNRLLDTKARKAALVRRMASQSQREICCACETQIWGPAHLIKEAAFTQSPNPPRLNDAGQAILQRLRPILRAYPEGYQFADSSLFLDAVIHPENHFWAYFRLSQLFERDWRQFEYFPQRKKWRPANMAVTTNILWSELLAGVPGRFGETALDTWGRVLNTASKPFRGRQFDFEEVVHTDAVGISVITRATGDGGDDGGDGDGAAPRGRQRRGWRRHGGRRNQGPEFQYVTELSADELAEDLGKCVFIDPGRRDILFCAHEDSTAENPQTYRYTRNQRSKETRMKRFARIREKVKPEAVRAAEARLSRFSSTTVNLRRYKQYLEARAAEWDLLSDFYSNTRTTGNSGGRTYPLHRRLRLSAHLNQQQADQRLARNLRSKFGENPVLEIGDWSAPMARHHEPIRGIGMRRMLRRQGFKVHLVPEFRTSSLCPACLTGRLENFRSVPNPRPFRRSAQPYVVCHGLLQCNNPDCLEPAGGRARRRYWNRDMAAVLNFKHILNGMHEDAEIPARFLRSTPRDAIGQPPQPPEPPQPPQPPEPPQPPRRGPPRKRRRTTTTTTTTTTFRHG